MSKLAKDRHGCPSIKLLVKDFSRARGRYEDLGDGWNRLIGVFCKFTKNRSHNDLRVSTLLQAFYILTHKYGLLSRWMTHWVNKSPHDLRSIYGFSCILFVGFLFSYILTLLICKIS